MICCSGEGRVVVAATGRDAAASIQSVRSRRPSSGKHSLCCGGDRCGTVVLR